MVSKATVVGTIQFRNPDTKLMCDLVVCLDPTTDLTFAVDSTWLEDSELVYSPFAHDISFRPVDPDHYMSDTDFEDTDIEDIDEDDDDSDD